MTRGYNFGAGPAMLPEPLLVEAQNEFLDWQGTGMSVMEAGHRTQEFDTLMKRAESNLRQLIGIPDNYHVLFMGGAARTQFAVIPMNFLGKKQFGGYLVTGIWSEFAFDEAKKLKAAYCVTSGKSEGFTTIPSADQWEIKKDSTYIYYTPNETVNGIRLPDPPKTHGIPLIADMTSCLLSEPIHVADYDLIFAGAQKNIANSGLTLVILSDRLLESINDPALPTMLDYRTYSESHSLYATPPTFNCYMADKMFQWILDEGGVEVLYQRNLEKAKRLYSYIDSSDFYQCKIDPPYRSIVNVCFSLAHSALEELFLTQAKTRGLLALKGHRFVGGLRASMYNSMPMAGVDALIQFMSDFAKEHPL
ncbi:3-phosphoserine/phosphohydroxythreonine transaminase [Legionella taurinensis]|uniref:Phosphoserine aminotransferase n=1 Tax=Legionella taurinensis TaxID=70611 RepID=A0A3A5L2L6_9GAMM|nr:3-phosphoserine/phosphohydroxythreonine transaminase [Legionella taurinensis]MDX1838244.1 3-phosphoserine/phosphohydroxythreonine transaminase [Legionella taurinensis]PUT39264.1 3-phosphoserine/phosphohydroxythreonine transaminase [Legionella taurinensis]PUT40610.1 3-phosphoserine/phosphohydroxythreonine transaminase [Legionella taurinensis]PUT44030.1 3-phosphoserine/phosphohydroxythreonine transaminase [Legionella taurinensis]PUT46292.1 3-phosphoserine/phosphohydroxythreonine transaminase 